MMRESIPQLTPQLSACNPFTFLPRLPGVETLSLHEIHSDLCELNRILSPTNSDSDSSIDSEDIAESFYPVKPRKGIRVVDRDEWQDSEKFEKLDAGLEVAISRIQTIAVKFRELHDAEVLFSDLDGFVEAYRWRYAGDKSNAEEQRDAHERYLRLLKAFALRQLNLRRTSVAQLAVFQRLLSTFNQQKGFQSAYQDASSLLAAQITAAPAKGRSRQNSSTSTSVGKVLRLHVGDTTHVCVAGVTTAHTPFGRASLVSWDSATQRLSLRLPFGILHCSASNFALWLLQSSASVEQLLVQCEGDLRRKDFNFRAQVQQRTALSASLSAEAEEMEVVEGESVSGAGQKESTVAASSSPFHLDSMSLTRAMLQTSLSQGLQHQFTSDLRLLLAPARSLLALERSRVAAQTALQWESAAFASDTNDVDPAREDVFASGQSLLWHGDVRHLRSQLLAQQQLMDELRRERTGIERELSAKRAETAKISAATAAVRLKMFTRRHSFRTVLHSNYTPPIAVQPQPTLESEFKGTRSRRSNSLTDDVADFADAPVNPSRKRVRDTDKDRESKRR